MTWRHPGETHRNLRGFSRASWPLIIPGDGTELRRHMAVQVEHHLIDIAPAPAFRRIIAFNDGVLGMMEMFGGMLATRLVAAANMAAGAADAQVKPFPAQLETFLAALGAGRDFLDRIQMRAKIVLGHYSAAAFCSSAARARAK